MTCHLANLETVMPDHSEVVRSLFPGHEHLIGLSQDAVGFVMIWPCIAGFADCQRGKPEVNFPPGRDFISWMPAR